MKANSQKIYPEDFILSVLNPRQRLEAALKVSEEAFKNSELTMKDVETAVKKIRKKIYARR